MNNWTLTPASAAIGFPRRLSSASRSRTVLFIRDWIPGILDLMTLSKCCNINMSHKLEVRMNIQSSRGVKGWICKGHIVLPCFHLSFFPLIPEIWSYVDKCMSNWLQIHQTSFIFPKPQTSEKPKYISVNFFNLKSTSQSRRFCRKGGFFCAY